MKKLNIIFGLIITTLIFTACSNDDSPADGTSSKIVGIWKSIKEVNVCSTGSETVYNYSTCEQTGRITFTSDGNINMTEFDDGNGTCVQIYNSNGTWSLNGDNLTVNIDGETINPTFFELTTNILRIGYHDADPNEPCDGGQLPSHYYIELIRVN